MNGLFRAGQIVIGLIAVSACASGPPSTPNQVDRVVGSTDAGDLRSYEGVPKVSVTVKAAPEAVLVALRGAYSEIGVEDKLSAPGSRRVGNSYFSKTSRLGGAPLSRYLECGSTMTGPAADNFPITISLVSVVAPAGTGSTIETLLSARTGGASSSSGTSSCRTLGTLEMQLNRILVRRLGE